MKGNNCKFEGKLKSFDIVSSLVYSPPEQNINYSYIDCQLISKGWTQN